MVNSLLSSDWLQTLQNYHNLYVGFSGGLDSTVLLDLLTKQINLHSKLTAVHIHHGLQPCADKWVEHVERICSHYNIPLIVKYLQIKSAGNIEEQARAARYKIFANLFTKSNKIQTNNALLLAHHANDLTETVLLNLFRGTGVDGLSAMQAVKTFSNGSLLRPLLKHTRLTLKEYAQSKNLNWIEDPSNDDIKYSRNYVRSVVLPLISKRWPQVSRNISRCVDNCQDARLNLHHLALNDCPTLADNQKPLPIVTLNNLAKWRKRNVLRTWLKQWTNKLPSYQFLEQIIHDVLEARPDRNPQIQCFGGTIFRFKLNLYFLKKEDLITNILTPVKWDNFPEALFLSSIQKQLVAIPANEGIKISKKSQIEIRYRSFGERIKIFGQTKVLKKLFQEWKVPPWIRSKLPLLFIDGKLASCIGYAIDDDFYGRNDRDLYRVE